MNVIYFDEVKYDPPNQPYYWLGGICLPLDRSMEIEGLANDLSDRVFGSPLLSKATEFHGRDVVQGKGNFKGRPIGTRLHVFRDLLSIITWEDIIIRIYVRIIPENMVYTKDKPEDVAFMYFVEQADILLDRLGGIGMIIGDYDEPVIGSSVASLAQFRKGGTYWRRGREINHIADTVHFAKSHHSRFIQLADVFLYALQFLLGHNTSGWRASFTEVIKESGVYQAGQSRIWPTSRDWYR